MRPDLTAIVLGSIFVALLFGLALGDWGGFAVLGFELVCLVAIGLRLRREAKRHPSRWS